MKIILYFSISTLFFFILSKINAQELNNNENFESWDIIDTKQVVPTGWSINNYPSTRTEDSYEGKYSALIWNWYYYGQGYLKNGMKVDGVDKIGTPFTYVPGVFNGTYKYLYDDNGGNNDSAIVKVTFTKFNIAKAYRDTVAAGFLKLGPTDVYKDFQVDIYKWNSNPEPDTVNIEFYSSENGFCATKGDGNCLYLYIDKLQFGTLLEINNSYFINSNQVNLSSDNNNFTFTLNDQFKVNSITILDINGKPVYENNLNSNVIKVNKEILNTEGLYIYKIASKEQILTGKLIK